MQLSGDVELHPGPVDELGESKILEAIRGSEERLMHRMDLMQNDIGTVRHEIAIVKEECNKTIQESDKIKENQNEQAHTLTKLLSSKI